jgi:tRNA (mo5U34)-methyltransferase
MNFTLFGYDRLYRWLQDSPLAHWLESVPQLAEERLAGHGDMPRWLEALAQLPDLTPESLDLSAPCLRIGSAGQVDEATRQQIRETLMAFHPWRKGPFCPYGIHLDTEWRSDWKWARLERRIDLTDKLVLDVGSGNGYYGWRMLGNGAKRVIAIDPTVGYVMQYVAMRHFIGEQPMHVLPLTLEALPQGNGVFDTVFSMGVIYHRKDHMEHLEQLIRHLKPGGELILEGLVIEGASGEALHPRGRYAKMKNVHTIPTTGTMMQWLAEAGLTGVELLDVSPTTVEEQRRTAWMHFESLVDYLDPQDPALTVEGHPAPARAVVTARRPR